MGSVVHPGNPLASARVDAVTGVEGEDDRLDPTSVACDKGVNPQR
jgi:hypothetical protein